MTIVLACSLFFATMFASGSALLAVTSREVEG